MVGVAPASALDTTMYDQFLIRFRTANPQFQNAGGFEKGLLRRAMTGLLPEDVLWRKKSPYPTTHNPAYLRQVKAMLTDRLRQPGSPLTRILDLHELERVMSAPESEAARRHWFGMYQKDAQFLAFLCQVDMWMTEYRVSIV